MYSKTLDRDLKGDLSGDDERLFVALAQVGAGRVAAAAPQRCPWRSPSAAPSATGPQPRPRPRPRRRRLIGGPAPPALQGKRTDRGSLSADVEALFHAGEGKVRGAPAPAQHRGLAARRPSARLRGRPACRPLP
jgi:hypothetical protein